MPELFKDFSPDAPELGRGGQKIVYEHPSDKTKAYAQLKYGHDLATQAQFTEYSLKARYYLVALVNTLHPNTFPRLQAVDVTNRRLAVERVGQNYTVEQYKQADAKVDALIPLGISLQKDLANTGVDARNNPVHLDLPEAFEGEAGGEWKKNYNAAKLAASLAFLEDGAQKVQGLAYLRRLEELYFTARGYGPEERGEFLKELEEMVLGEGG